MLTWFRAGAPTGGNPSQIFKSKTILKKSITNAFPYANIFYFKLRFKTSESAKLLISLEGTPLPSHTHTHTHTHKFSTQKIFKKSIINTDHYVVLFNSNIFLRHLKLLIFTIFKRFKLLKFKKYCENFARENLFVASTPLVGKMMPRSSS